MQRCLHVTCILHVSFRRLGQDMNENSSEEEITGRDCMVEAIHVPDNMGRTDGSLVWWCSTSRGCTVAATESSFTFRAELLNGQKSFYRQPCEISHCPEVCDAYVCVCESVFVSRGFLSRRLHRILGWSEKIERLFFDEWWKFSRLRGLISVKWNFETLQKFLIFF